MNSRRKYRKKIRELEEIIEISESRFQTLYDVVPLPMEIYSRSGNLLKANPASKKFWGDQGPAIDSVARYMDQALEDESFELKDYKVHPEHDQWEDGPKWLKTHILPCQVPVSNGNNVILIHEETTQYYKLKADLHDLKQLIKVGNGTRDAFLGILSHELRTPLNWIMGFTDLIRLEEPGEKISEYSQIISSSVITLMSIIDSLIDISLIESDSIRLNRVEFNLTDLFGEIKEKVLDEKTVENSKIKFRVKNILKETLTGVYTDRIVLKKVLEYLVDNALKYTSEGFVEIGCEKTGDDQLLFFVRDSGIGIARDQYPVIFEKFRKVDDSEARTYSGIGLGLSVSKGFIEKLGGNLWIESNPGEGSSFYFNLPDWRPSFS
jgi:signal transduction histidine kinase